MDSRIRNLELYAYFSLWTSAICFSLYKLIESQNDILNQDNRILYLDLSPGWSFISRMKDASDIEWTTWKYFFYTSWFYFVVNFIISEIIRNIKLFPLKYWYILSTIIFIKIYMGIEQLILIILQPSIFAALILYGGKKTSVWMASISCLILLNTLKYQFFFDYVLNSVTNDEINLLVFSLTWVVLRCISFCIDYIDSNEKAEISQTDTAAYSETIINMFSYVLYLPLVYTGPMILYEDFKKSFHVKKQTLSERLKYFITDMCIFQFYTIALEFALHYIYFSAMHNDVTSIKKMSSYGLCGGGLWMGLQFQLIYVIAYGTTCAFARLDHVDAPPTPRCIARIHIYSEMWRYFDVGLHKFLVKYIYKPMLGIVFKNFTTNKMLGKSIAILVTFAFIQIWHGTVWDIFLWCLMNYCGIMLEQLAKSMSNTSTYKNFKVNILQTDSMESRFVALLCTPLLMLSAMSNFYLLAGSNVANWYVECFFHPTFLNAAIVSISLYSCCHVSMALTNVHSRTCTTIKTKQ